MNTVTITDQQTKLKFCSLYSDIITKSVNEAAKYRGEGGLEVSVLITDNEGIRKLNYEYRGIDSETDVLSFPMRDIGGEEISLSCENSEDKLLGDIVISLEKAAEQAELYGHGIERELGFLTVHSMLHLFGFDHIDEDDAKTMRSMEEEILKIMNLSIA